MINNHMDQAPTAVFDSHFIDCSQNGLEPVTFADDDDDDDDDNGNDVLQSNISQ